MIRERAMELVAALRSGDYKQAKERLRLKGCGYCCLGVACDISKLGHWDNGDYITTDEEDGCRRYDDTRLPVVVQNYFDFGTEEGSIPVILQPDHRQLETVDGSKSKLTSLAEMNDHGYTFAEIADFIEKNWEVL